MLNTVIPMLLTPQLNKPVIWRPAYALTRNCVWWDAVYTWCACNNQFVELQWKQYAESRYVWWTRCMFTRYPQGGIWDWHTDQSVIKDSYNRADNHATRTLTGVVRGHIEIQTADHIHAVAAGMAVMFPSTTPYLLTAVPNTECVSVWAMYPYKYYPENPQQAKYKKRNY